MLLISQEGLIVPSLEFVWWLGVVTSVVTRYVEWSVVTALENVRRYWVAPFVIGGHCESSLPFEMLLWSSWRVVVHAWYRRAPVHAWSRGTWSRLRRALVHAWSRLTWSLF